MKEKPNCDDCRAPLTWHKAISTPTNKTPKMNPLDREPNEKGNIFIFANGQYVVLAGTTLNNAREQKQPLYTSHFATCPNAKRFRRK